MKIAFMLLLTVCFCSPALAIQPMAPHADPNASAPVHNGRWWEDKSSAYHDAFIGGYKAGAKYTAGHTVDVNKFQGSDLVDGLDHFYKDYRNHNILIDNALHFVEEQLSGVSDDKLKAEVLKMRAEAAPTVVE